MTNAQALWDRLAASGLLIDARLTETIEFIDHLANDSRKVGPNGLFVAIRGGQSDGHLFIDKAVNNGAIAIVCEVVPEEASERFPGTAFVHVRNSRAALAELAQVFYGDPSTDLTLMGITGTNGKTTTAFLTHFLFQGLGLPAGLLSTVEYRIGEEAIPASHTTPDVLDIARMMRAMVDQGCRACAMEVSSHALDQDRVRGLHFDIGVFSNLSQDHLDYHATMAAYLEAKKQLFLMLPAHAHAITNLDDPAGAKMIEGIQANVLSYGTLEEATFKLRIIEDSIEGLRLELEGQERLFRLAGAFNAYNLAAAYSVGRALGRSSTEVLDVLENAPPVPGRFEKIRVSNQRHVVVDYAHTPDALENILKALQRAKASDATLWCIFGCGGDRDPIKRPMMGQIAEQFADRVIVTSDNPRTENPQKILDDIRPGLQRPADAFWEVDRRAAIQLAANEAAPGDVVLVAGKGHEPYQVIGTESLPFDDREEVRQIFGSP